MAQIWVDYSKSPKAKTWHELLNENFSDADMAWMNGPYAFVVRKTFIALAGTAGVVIATAGAVAAWLFA